MALLDLLGRRWALGILWRLRDGPVGFLELQTRLDRVSSSVLTQRLRELADAEIVTRDASGRYCLTDEGRELGLSLLEINRWADAWAGRRGLRPPPRRRGAAARAGSPRARRARRE